MPKFQKKSAPAAIEVAPPEVEAAALASEPDTAHLSDEALIADPKLVEIWERRFTNPGALPSRPIPVKIKGMTLRWINTTVEGRYHRAYYEQGWRPVPRTLLVDENDIPDLHISPDGFVCRGEKGKERLMMMPEDVFKKIQRRKAELNQKSLQNIRSEVAQAAAQKYGSEAGDFIDSGQTRDGRIKAVGSINFGHERVPASEGR